MAVPLIEPEFGPATIPPMPESDDPTYALVVGSAFWKCPECLLLTADPEEHTAWHRSLDEILSRP